jgi:hypothetical protein
VTSPISEVIDAIEAPTTTVTRRAVIFESDGETVWLKPGTESRLIGGTVSVDYARDERRALDITFDNRDGLLEHDPVAGLWYDKIIKVYRGIEYVVPSRQPRILIIQDDASRMRTELRNIGFYTTFVNLNPTSLADFFGYDIIVADSNTGAISAPKAALLASANAMGYQVFTTGRNNGNPQIPWITTTIAKASDGIFWALTPSTTDTPVTGGWGTVTYNFSLAGLLATVLASTAKPAGTFVYSSTTTYPAAYNVDGDGNKWFHLQPNQGWEVNTRALIQKAILWLFGSQGVRSYETQLGEFMIDRIDEDWFPNQVKITGRDYTKKLMLSKLGNGVLFAAGTSIETIVNAEAALAGVFKTTISTAGRALAIDISFEKNTDRWTVIKSICTAYQFEVFFDAFGFLTVRPFLDPLTSPTSLILKTGSEGNLVTYAKSSNDSRIFNHVTVTSDNQDVIGEGGTIFAEALNTEPSSPTRIERMSDRTFPYVSSIIATVEDAQALANTWLRISALEEFNLNFSTLVYFWLEAGTVVGFIDPKAGVDEPVRFLLSNFGIPLTLEPMTGIGKRISIVGSGSVPGDVLFAEATP